MSLNKKPVKGQGPVVGILGHTGNENLGDESIKQAVIENLAERLPGVRFRLFSMNPEDSRRRFQLPSFLLRPEQRATVSSLLYCNWTPSGAAEGGRAPLHEAGHGPVTTVQGPGFKQRVKAYIRLFLYLPFVIANEVRFNRQSASLLRDMNVLIVCGSNQFLDNFGGPWAFPYTLLRWSWLASRTNTQLVFASVGAGPIYSPLSLWLINRALDYARYVSVRDVASQELLQAGGFNGQLAVVPDLAFSLKSLGTSDEELRSDSKPVIGINPMPVYAKHYWYVADSELYSAYVKTMADLAGVLIAKGFPVFLFATQKRDERVIEDIRANLSKMDGVSDQNKAIAKPCQSVAELQMVIESADFIVATRFHATVLGLKANKLVVGACYYRKAADLLREFGLGDYAFPLEKMKLNDIMVAIDTMLSRQSELGAKVVAQNEEQLRVLNRQYDKICALVYGE